MPMDVRAVTAAGEIHPNPIVGPVDHVVAIRVDVSTMTADYVDSRGYLKPGVPLARSGIPVGVAPAFVFGVVVEAVKVHTDNTTLAAVTRDIDVTVATHGTVNRAILEDSLGRALNAAELAGFIAAGSHVALLY